MADEDQPSTGGPTVGPRHGATLTLETSRHRSRDRHRHDRQRPDGQVAHDGLPQRRECLRHHAFQAALRGSGRRERGSRPRGAESLGYARWTTDWREAVKRSERRCGRHRHAQLPAQGNRHGGDRAGKHVYCEKPLALTAADAKADVRRRRSGRRQDDRRLQLPAQPGHRRGPPADRQGVLGDIWTFTGRFVLDACSDPDVPFTWRFERKLSGSGALGDLGAHIISLAQVLVGPITSVAGRSRTFIKTRPEPTGVFGYGSGADLDAPRREVENDDATTFLMDFASGASGQSRPPGLPPAAPGTRASRSSAARAPCSSCSRTSTPCGST